jgi:hypothetical protein
MTDRGRRRWSDGSPRRSSRRKEDPMHVVMLSLMIALAVCVLVLIGFGLFTRSAAAQRIGGPRAIESRR